MWGSELILIYNDAYRSFPGPRHPWALGKPQRRSTSSPGPSSALCSKMPIDTGETLFYEKLLVPLPTETGVRPKLPQLLLQPHL